MTEEPDYVVLRSPVLMRAPWLDIARRNWKTMRFPTITHDGLRYVDVRWEDCRPTGEFQVGEGGEVAQVWEHLP